MVKATCKLDISEVKPPQKRDLYTGLISISAISHLPTLTLVQNFAGDRQESILRYGRFLHTHLSEALNGKASVRSIAPTSLATRFFNPQSKAFKAASYVDRLLLFNASLTFQQSDLFHVLCQPEFLTGLGSKRKVFTCHDLIPILQAEEGLLGGLPKGSKANLLFPWWRKAIRSADHVICISEASRRDLVRLIPYPEEKTTVVHLAINRTLHAHDPSAARALLGELNPLLKNSPFILHVGNSHRYKNRDGVMRIFERLSAQHPDLLLLFCGKPFAAHEVAERSRSPFQDRIILLNQPSDAIVDASYSAAQLLLFPSLYEGYGWPALEAMTLGCPVVGSDRGGLREILPNPAFALNPENEGNVADVCSSLLSDEALRQDAIEMGYAHASNFTTDKMITAYCAIYRRLGIR